MNLINFKKVGMENYCLFIDPVELEFKSNKVTLICGPNGVGKTSILEAMPFTIYGQTSKGLRGPDAVNNKVGKNCHTWVEWELNNENYRIDRYYKASKYGNGVILTKGNEVIANGHTEVLRKVERMMVPYKLFSNIMFFSQRVKDFFTDLTDSEQKEIFRKVMQLDDYVLFQKETGKRIDIVKDQIKEIENAISVKNSLVFDCNKTIQEFIEMKKEFELRKKQEIQELEIEIQKKEEEILELEKLNENERKFVELDLEKINNEINEFVSVINNLEIKLLNNVGKLEEAARKKQYELESAASELRLSFEKEKNEKLSKLNSEYFEQNQKTNSLINDIEKNKSAIEFENNTLNNQCKSYQEEKQAYIENVLEKEISVCPVCYQKIDEKTKENLENHIKELEIIILDNQKKISLNNENISELNRKILSLKNEINDNQTKLQESKKEIEEEFNNNIIINVNKRLEEKLGMLNQAVEVEKTKIKEIHDMQIKEAERQKQEKIEVRETVKKNLDVQTERLSKINSLKEDIQYSKRNIQTKENEEFDSKPLENYKKKGQTLLGELNDCENEIKTLNRDLHILEFHKEAFSPTGIPSMLIDEAIPFMNNSISNYMSRISGGRYTVSFDTLKSTKAGEFRDKISVNVFDNKTHADKRVQLSGGQTRLIDIATILTLSDLQSSIQAMKFNILLFDEIFDSLDDENIGSVCNILKQLSLEKSIIIISHRHIDQIEADEILSFYS